VCSSDLVCKGSIAIPVFDIREMVDDTNYYLDFNQWLTCWGMLDGKNVRYYLGGVIVYTKTLNPFTVVTDSNQKVKGDSHEIKNFSIQIFTELLDMAKVTTGDDTGHGNFEGVNKWVDVSTRDMNLKHLYMTTQRDAVNSICTTPIDPEPIPVDPELPRISKEDGIVPPTDPIECAFPDSLNLVVELND
jgi:hypothetical protein